MGLPGAGGPHACSLPCCTLRAVTNFNGPLFYTVREVTVQGIAQQTVAPRRQNRANGWGVRWPHGTSLQTLLYRQRKRGTLACKDSDEKRYLCTVAVPVATPLMRRWHQGSQYSESGCSPAGGEQRTVSVGCEMQEPAPPSTLLVLGRSPRQPPRPRGQPPSPPSRGLSRPAPHLASAARAVPAAARLGRPAAGLSARVTGSGGAGCPSPLPRTRARGTATSHPPA